VELDLSALLSKVLVAKSEDHVVISIFETLLVFFFVPTAFTNAVPNPGKKKDHA
jgi:hypothetical protein